MRLGLVTTYTPRRHELAQPASELRRRLVAGCRVSVCAVDRHGLEYPDEVTAVIAEDRLADYHRAARILAEHGCDAVLIEYEDGLYGGAGGRHILDLAHELLARGIPYLVRPHSPRPARGPGRLVLGDLSGAAAAVLRPSAAPDAVLDAARTALLTDIGHRRVVPRPMGVAAGAVSGGWHTHVRIPGSPPGGVPLVPGLPPGAPPQPPGEFTATPDLALLAIAAADLAAVSLPGTDESTTAQRWSRQALAGLVNGGYHEGWRIRGLAALTRPGLSPGLRGRAELALGRRLDRFTAGDGAVGDGLAVADAAHVVLGLCGMPGESAWRTGLTRIAAARRRATRGPNWPWFADRLPGGGIRLPHALLVGAYAANDLTLAAQAIESLDWYLRRAGLADVDGTLALPTIGGERAVDVADMVLALVDARRITGRARYGRLALRTLAWFAGVNRYGVAAYDPHKGGCLDRIGAAARPTAGAWLAYRAAVRAVCTAGLAVPDLAVPDLAMSAPAVPALAVSAPAGTTVAVPDPAPVVLDAVPLGVDHGPARDNLAEAA